MAKAYVFPGQGAQFVGMGKGLYDRALSFTHPVLSFWHYTKCKRLKIKRLRISRITLPPRVGDLEPPDARLLLS